MALVDEYVQSAAPVGSSCIARQYLTEVSAATVRNELMGLETEGYALSPHTSAGRVPTNSGYRVFVNALLLRESLGEGLRTRPQQQSQQLPQQFAAPTGDTTAAGTGTELHDLDLQGFDLHTLDPEQHIDQVLAHLSATTGLLSVLCSVRSDITVRHRGMPQLLAQPEFHDSSALLPLIQLIEDRVSLAHVLLGELWGSGFCVKIGIGEAGRDLAPYSVVAEFFGSEQAKHVLAVFGPTRMNYRKVIPAVLVASRLLGQTRVGVGTRMGAATTKGNLWR
ncbi:MAG: hypothetical protein LBU31_03810 [Coriobacteriales bacterium]|jgi:transcriptional regulator of heat shock response|nr:hypothetical protein [Coriobacteriales bacterium]